MSEKSRKCGCAFLSSAKRRGQKAACPTRRSSPKLNLIPKKTGLKPCFLYKENFRIVGRRGGRWAWQKNPVWKKNMPLKENPQRGKTEKAYVRNGIVSGKKRSYGKPMKNYEFSKEDQGNVKAKIRNYKKRREKRQKMSKPRGWDPPTCLLIANLSIALLLYPKKRKKSTG